MLILGRGFIAQNLAALRPAHPQALAFARGVSTTACVEQAAFDEEAAALHDALRLCRATGLRLVYFSTASASMYGSPISNGREDGPVDPPTAYGRHKLAMEAVIAESGVDALVLRLSHLVGHRQRDHQLFPGLTAQILSGEIRMQVGANRDLLDVRDLVRIVDALLASRAPGGLLNVASGFPVPVPDLLDAMEEQLGVRASRLPVTGAAVAPPVSVARMHALVPIADRLGFGRDYYRALVRRYVEAPALTPNVHLVDKTT